MKDQNLKPLPQEKRDECRALIASIKANNYDDFYSAAQLAALNHEYDTSQKVFEENGRKGVKDFDNNVIVPAIFDDIIETYTAPYFDRPIPVIKDGKACLVTPDGSGKVIQGFDYDTIHSTWIGYICTKGEYKGLLSGSGLVLIPCEMDEIYDPYNNLIAFEKDGKTGYWYDGVLSEEFYEESFIIDTCDLLCVYRMKDGKKVSGYLDKEGRFTTEFEDAWFGVYC